MAFRMHLSGAKKMAPHCERWILMTQVWALRQWTNAYVYAAVANNFLEDHIDGETQRILGSHRAGAVVLTSALQNYRRKTFRRTLNNFRLNAMLGRVTDKSDAVIREAMDERHGVLAKSREQRELLTAKLDRQQKEVQKLIAQVRIS